MIVKIIDDILGRKRTLIQISRAYRIPVKDIENMLEELDADTYKKVMTALYSARAERAKQLQLKN